MFLRALLFTIVSSCFASLSLAEDWPQFLGPQRNGISSEKRLIDKFPAKGPSIVWRKSLGAGMSGIVVHDGVALTMCQDAKRQYVVALDTQTGDEKWKSDVAPMYKNGMGNGPRATPTIHDGAVYSFSGEGILTKLDEKTGDIVWSVNATKKLSTKPSEYGMSSSPLIAGDCVVVQVGSEEGTVAAYDLASGKQKWVAGSGRAGYSSPVLMTLAGKNQIVAFCGATVMGIDPKRGEKLWDYPFETEYDCNTASPVQLSDTTVLISAGENHGSVILEITGKNKSKNDSMLARSTWESLGKKSVLRAEWQTPVLAGDYLFALDNIGSAGPITNLVCVNRANGNQVWMEKRFGKSNLTLADGKLYISTMEGELVIVQASSDGFSETGRADVLGMTRQAPAISNGMLYLRDDKEVVCIDIRQNK